MCRFEKSARRKRERRVTTAFVILRERGESPGFFAKDAFFTRKEFVILNPAQRAPGRILEVRAQSRSQRQDRVPFGRTLLRMTSFHFDSISPTFSTHSE